MNNNMKDWDALVCYWHEIHGEKGDWYHQFVLYPLYMSKIVAIIKKTGTNLTVLDVGCATGILARLLSQLNLEVVGIDSSFSMLKYAKHKKGKEKYIQMDINELYFSKFQLFDVAISDMAMQSITNINNFLLNLSDILKKNAIFIFSIEHPFFSLFQYTHITTKRNLIGYANPVESSEIIETYLKRPEETIIWKKQLHTRRYLKTLQDYSSALSKTGFLIKTILEPLPVPEGSFDNEKYSLCIRIPKFLVFETINSRTIHND